MKKLVDFKLQALRKLHRNENGAEAGLERILLVAFIALPLLGLLMHYRGEVVKFIKDAWSTNASDGPGNLTNGG